MAEENERPKPSKPPPKLDEPPRTKSGEMHAVRAYRDKLESIAEGTFEDAVSLNDRLADYLTALRATTHPPAPAELPPDENDIVGWDDERDEPVRRRDLLLRTSTPREFKPVPTSTLHFRDTATDEVAVPRLPPRPNPSKK